MKTMYHYRHINSKINLFFTDQYDNYHTKGYLSYQGGVLGAMGYKGFAEYTWEQNAVVINAIEAHPKRMGIGALMIAILAQKAINTFRGRVELTHTAPTAYQFYLSLGFHKKRSDVKDARTARQLPKIINNPLHNLQAFTERLGARVYLWDGDAMMILRMAKENIEHKWEIADFQYA